MILMPALPPSTSKYGKSNRNKYRAVFYYLLVRHFKRESVYA